MQTVSSYSIDLPVYQGPMDLLLELIERAELDITKISLAKVTDQYLAHIRQLQARSLSDIAAFLVIAARLIQIKSEALLPRPPERELGEEDPGDALARQLVAYKKYKQVATLLAEREKAGLRSFLRVVLPPVVELKLDLEGLTADDLRRAMEEALANQPRPPEIRRAIAPPRVNIRQKIALIVDAIRRSGKLSFRRILKKSRSRLEAVISFLALLELIKQNQVQAEQPELFGDIAVTPGSAWKADQELEFDLEFDE